MTIMLEGFSSPPPSLFQSCLEFCQMLSIINCLNLSNGRNSLVEWLLGAMIGKCYQHPSHWGISLGKWLSTHLALNRVNLVAHADMQRMQTQEKLSALPWIRRITNLQ